MKLIETNRPLPPQTKFTCKVPIRLCPAPVAENLQDLLEKASRLKIITPNTPFTILKVRQKGSSIWYAVGVPLTGETGWINHKALIRPNSLTYLGREKPKRGVQARNG